jgi:hypothetical protein
MPRNLYINPGEILGVIANNDVVVGLTPSCKYGMPVPYVKYRETIALDRPASCGKKKQQKSQRGIGSS